MRSILILPDLQIPYHDPKFVKVMENFIREYRPDEVGQIGDFLDQPQPSRWSKGMAGEYAGQLQKDINLGKELIDRLRIDWIKLGNHDERIEIYVDRYAPALSDLQCIRIEQLLGLEEKGVVLRREPFEVAPGWIAAHGHEGGLSSVAGRTAFGLAKRYDSSVVCGHTHRAGIVSETVGIVRRRVITGLEVGHGMDLRKATYVRQPNWQQAFGVLKVDGRLVQPELIPVHNGTFIYEGKRYSG